MLVLVDGCPLQTPARDRGIGRFTSGLIGGLKCVRPGWRIEVVEHGRLPAIPPHRVHGLPVRRFDAPLPYDLAVEPNRAVNDRYYADWLLARRPDHLLFVSVFEKLGVVPKFVDRRPALSAVMHDLIPILFPEQYDICQPGERWYARRLRAIASSDVIFSNSEVTADDTRRLLGRSCPPVVNIQGAVEQNFTPLAGERLDAASRLVREKYGITGPFVLYVGGYDYRKNLSGAVAGFAALPPAVRAGLQLVIACFLPDWLRAETLRTAWQLGLQDQVIVTGFVPDEDLLVLYQSARVFFFPSFYEGLGFPVLEALRCGTPVVCSNSSSLPEFAGDVSRMCDPADPASMAAALAAALAEPEEDRRADRIAFARTFTWERSAEKAACEIEAVRPAPRPARRRLAWVMTSPPPVPEPADLLTAAARQCDVELVLPTRDAPGRLASRHRLLTPEEIEDRQDADPFDLFVVTVEPPGPAQLVLEAAARHRCLVLLDDIDPSRYRVEQTWRLLARAAGVVVRSAAARHWVRSLTDTPVVLLPGGIDDEVAGRLFAAAVEDTVARIDSSDSRWFDSVANALAAVPGPLPPELFEGWAALRRSTRRSPGPAPFELPERISA